MSGLKGYCDWCPIFLIITDYITDFEVMYFVCNLKIIKKNLDKNLEHLLIYSVVPSTFIRNNRGQLCVYFGFIF